MFGKMIRFMRFTRNYKQNDLSKKFGIANSTLAHYESEYRLVTLEMAHKIAKECDFEIQFKDKITNKIYTVDDLKRMNYDIRIKDK